MSMFTLAYLLRPENLHEIAGPGLIEIVEVWAETEFVKKPGGAGSIRVPTTPNSFAVVLIANDEVVEGRKVERKLSTRTQRLNRSDKHVVSCARTETRKRRCGQNKKFPGLKMRRGLQLDLGKSGDRVTAALWHLFYLLEHDSIEVFSGRFNSTQPQDGDADASHAQRLQHVGQLSGKFKEGNAQREQNDEARMANDESIMKPE